MSLSMYSTTEREPTSQHTHPSSIVEKLGRSIDAARDRHVRVYTFQFFPELMSLLDLRMTDSVDCVETASASKFRSSIARAQQFTLLLASLPDTHSSLSAMVGSQHHRADAHIGFLGTIAFVVSCFSPQECILIEQLSFRRWVVRGVAT